MSIQLIPQIRAWLAVGIIVLVTGLSGCVTETTGSIFEEPTEEDLEAAVGLYVQLAYNMLKDQRYERAMRFLDSAMEIDAGSPVVLTGLATAYQAQGEKEKADKTFKKAIRADRKYSEAYLRYGGYLYEMGDYENACENFKKASENDFYENRSDAFFNLGMCKKALGDIKGAEYAFTRAMDLKPKSYEALLELSEIKFLRQDYVASKKLFDRFVGMVREHKDILSARALWLGIQLENYFDNKDAVSSLSLQLKNNYLYSDEYTKYREMFGISR